MSSRIQRDRAFGRRRKPEVPLRPADTPEQEALRVEECARKRRYATMASAELVRWKIPQIEGTHAYRCPWCGGWHVGHISGRYGGEELRP